MGFHRIPQRVEDDCPIDKLIFHPRNANQGDVGMVSESIEENGWYGFVLAQESTGYIIAGHTRVRSARALGATHLPVVWLDVPDAVKAMKMLIVDNRSTRAGWDDPNVMTENLVEINMTDESGLLGTGYDIDDLDNMMQDLTDLPPVEDGEGRQGKPVLLVTALDEMSAMNLGSVLAKFGRPIPKISIHCQSAAERDAVKAYLIEQGYAVTANGET